MARGIQDKKNMGMPTVVSLFAGCGGSSLGYKWAGYRELLAVDFDENVADVFKLNFPEVQFWHKDITEIIPGDILKACKLKAGELDMLDGSPPCQGFSMSGRRNVGDSRNDLFMDFIRVIKGLKPRVFLMENVPGQAQGKMKGRFKEIFKALKSTGYQVKCRKMNSKFYGVAQSRQRLIYIGCRPDMPAPSYPKPQKIVIIREALKAVKNKNYFEGKDWHSMALSYIKPGMAAVDCIPVEILKKYVRRMANNTKFNYGGMCMRLSWFGVCPTLTKLFIPFANSFVHPREDRFITIEEAKRLCSFPDDFKLTGKFKDQWAALGNSVMPKFMEAIALHIKKEILIYGKKDG